MILNAISTVVVKDQCVKQSRYPPAAWLPGAADTYPQKDPVQLGSHRSVGFGRLIHRLARGLVIGSHPSKVC
jgi:hypothetical protein